MSEISSRRRRAQREVGLAAGEPPARQGDPPSVFSALPRLLERTGARTRGGITAVYTVLVAGGDMEEPIADEVRGLLDGHVVLERSLAARGRFPAVDVPRSLSRLMPAGASPEHPHGRDAGAGPPGGLGVAAGPHRPGGLAARADPLVDEAVERMPAVEAFLSQGTRECTPFEETVGRLEALAR